MRHNQVLPISSRVTAPTVFMGDVSHCWPYILSIFCRDALSPWERGAAWRHCKHIRSDIPRHGRWRKFQKFLHHRSAMVFRAESSKIKAQRNIGSAFAFQLGELSAFGFEPRDDIGLRVRPALGDWIRYVGSSWIQCTQPVFEKSWCPAMGQPDPPV